MERRFLAQRSYPVQLERRAEGQPELITGYAAVFYDPADPGTEYKFSGWWDNFSERIMPAAFDQAVKEDDVRALFNHNPDHLIGRSTANTLALSVDKKGLRYEITPPDTQIANQVRANITRQELTGSSFSFQAMEIAWREEVLPDNSVRVVREIHRAKLFDVGPVTFPAYEATTAGVRAASDLEEAKASYATWKKDQLRAIGQGLAQAVLGSQRKRRLQIEELDLI